METDDGVILEEVLDDEGWAPEDRINPLNQVMRRDVTDSGGTDSWAYTWTADGQLASKTDGTDTWDFSWDEDSRLVRVEGPGGLDIEFVYDSMGRMLRRIDGVNSWAFEWDGWDLVRETAPDGTVTRYFSPQGELFRFERGNELYSVHFDALNGVRMITDSAARIASEFQYGAFGEVLDSSFDGVPGGFLYRFVGALGCRAEPDFGLIYMRNRWYDPEWGCWVSRDQRLESNLYLYAYGSPTNLIDDEGLRGRPAPGGGRAPSRGNWGQRKTGGSWPTRGECKNPDLPPLLPNEVPMRFPVLPPVIPLRASEDPKKSPLYEKRQKRLHAMLDECVQAAFRDMEDCFETCQSLRYPYVIPIGPGCDPCNPIKYPFPTPFQGLKDCLQQCEDDYFNKFNQCHLDFLKAGGDF